MQPELTPVTCEQAVPAVCPVSPAHQTRNMLLFAGNVSLIYLGGSVLYVGITEAALCQKLGTSSAVANLPTTAFGFGSLVPILVAWCFPSVSLLKPIISSCYALCALAGLIMTMLLVTPSPTALVVWSLIAYGFLIGGAMQVIGTFQFEALGRGMSERRRSQTFWLAYGVGPLIALVGSLASQAVLSGAVELPYYDRSQGMSLAHLTFPTLAFPWNFAVLFAVTVPLMALAAVFSMLFVIPRAEQQVERLPFLEGTIGGVGKILANPTIRIAALATVLIYAGNMILSNVSLYTKQSLGTAAEEYVGYQNAMRFGSKSLSGAIIGWLLTTTNPKSGLTATALVGLTGVLWATFVPGKWFMLSFALLGAGELFATYYSNYILACSPRSKMRRNMAFTYMLPLVASPAGWMFGKISDVYHQDHRPSFIVAALILAATLGLVLFGLPARPRPRVEDMDESDLVLERRPIAAGNPPREG